jgi:uncharacterized protein YdiU (UPF0061 family)
VNFNFFNTYTTLPADFFTPWLPEKVKAPKLFCFNTDLANTLGIKRDAFSDEALADYFSGNTLFEDASPIALAYAGHQFGYFITPLKNKLKNQLAYRTFGCLKKLATF